MNKRLVVAVVVGSLGGFVFGFDLGALSAATQSLKAQFALSPWAFGLTISASIWATVGGAILAGSFADRCNRKSLIVWCAILYGVAAVGTAMVAPSEWLLLLAMRLLCGVAIGGLTVGCPLYLSELAPIAMRGRVVGLFQVQVSIGVIAAFFIGAVYVHFEPLGAVWKLVLGLGAVPAGTLFFLMRFMPRIAAPMSTEHDAPLALGTSRQTIAGPHQRLFVRRNLSSSCLRRASPSSTSFPGSMFSCSICWRFWRARG